MILVLSSETSPADVDQLTDRLEWMGLNVSPQKIENRLCLAVLSGLDEHVHPEHFQQLPHVEDVREFSRPFKLAGTDLHDDRREIQIEDVTIGGNELTVMAGPCSVESEHQIMETARAVADAGAEVLRGGAFKPRTSPYSFQGLGERGLALLHAAGSEHGLKVITEVMGTDQIEKVAEHTDIFQVGARNMQNYNLLRELGKADKPVFLKRGFSNTYRELILASEYILEGGNEDVMLCERGIRTFETYTRNTPDVAAIPTLHELTSLPVIMDPSHGTGIRRMVKPLARAGVAAGADGIMVEVHPDPDRALSDAQQQLSTDEFEALMNELRKVGSAVENPVTERA